MKHLFLVFIVTLVSIKCTAQYTPRCIDSLQKKDSSNIKFNKPFAVTSNYTTLGWGFFCKKEWQLEKVIKIPFKFRLGSVSDCDKLEGKKN